MKASTHAISIQFPGRQPRIVLDFAYFHDIGTDQGL